MEKLVQVIDADYEVESGEVTVRCFGKSKEGENFVFVDESFLPYLYVLPEEDQDVEKLREDIEAKNFIEEEEPLPVEKTEIKELTDLNREREVLKVYTCTPPKVPKLKNKLWDIEGVRKCREFDIPFYRRYLIDKEIRPGSWIRVEGEETGAECVENLMSVEAVETDLDKEEDIDWKMLAFDLEVYKDQIIMASMYGEDYRKVLTTEDIDKNYVETVESEGDIIERLVEIVEERDVDVITGYNTDEFDFQVLRERSNEHGIELSMGRDGERMKFNRRGRFKGARLKGRMHLDIYPFIEHVISPGLESETLDLDSVAEEMLGENKDEMSWEKMKESWREKQDLEKFVEYALRDSELAYKLGEELVPQIMELSRIVGLIPFDASRLTYGQLTENYLLREAHERGKMAPNRPSQEKRRKRRREGAYSGGFVYTPDAGLYENLALFDFKSLYPTVMVAHNISPDTLNLEGCDDRFQLEDFDYDFCQDDQGFFPELVEGLVKDRTEIKEEMAELEEESSDYQALDNRQQAEKILANSVGPETDLVFKDPQDRVRVLSIQEFYNTLASNEKGVQGSNYKEVSGWNALSIEEDKAVFKPVYAASKHDAEDAFRVKTGMGEVTVTGDHSIITMDGDSSNRVRDSKFEGLDKSKGSEVSKGDIIAQVNKLELEGSEEDLVIPRVLKNRSEDFWLYIPKSENLDKKKWYENRVKVMDAVRNGLNSVEIQEEVGVERRVLKRARENNLIRKVAVTGRRGNAYECEITEKGKKYYQFYKVFRKAEKNAEHYLISLNRLDTLPPEEILENSFVANKSGRARNKIPAVIPLDKSFASLLGWFVAEGHVREDGTEKGSYVDMAITSNDPEAREEVANLFRKVFNYDPTVHRNQVSCCTSTIARIFSELCGERAEEKKVPEPIFNAEKEVRESFLESYTEGDGDSDGRRLSTISRKLKSGLSVLLKGEDCILHNGFDTDTYRISRRSKTQGEKIVSGDLYGQKPKDIEEVEKPEKVYDVSVKDTEKFVTAEGLVLHNSFYGYLGYNGARWYSRECAEATTYLGREHIQETIETAENMGFEVVYGDSLNYSRQIVVRDPSGTIRFIEIGEFVEEVENPGGYQTLAFDIDDEKAVFKPVNRAIKHEYNGELLRFDTSRGRTEVTPQHSVYKFENGKIQLADAEKLEEGDKLVSLSEPPEIQNEYSEGEILDVADFELTEDMRAYRDKKRFPAERGECPYCDEEYYLSSHVHAKHSDRKIEIKEVTEKHEYIGAQNAKAGRIPRFWELNKEFAWILGYYCGDGSASVGEKKMISFGGQDKGLIEKIKNFFDERLEADLKIIEDIDDRTGNKMYYYRVQRKPLVEFFVKGLGVGIGPEGKRVPDLILNSGQNLKRGFIEGYTAADGSIESEVDDRYDSKNIRFSSKSSFLSNHVQYLLKQLENGENRYGREINDVSYKYRDDKPKIKSIRTTASQKAVYNGWGFTPAEINNIERVQPEKESVYDIEVEGHHNFVDAEGLMLVHNTDSVFLKKDNIREEMDQFLDKVNSELPRFMQLEFEGFFVRGFFTSTESGEGAKKKYALMDEDGGMKITGFEQVRRDWSPIAKKTQKEVLREVLDNDVEEAAEIVKDTIERLKQGEVPVEELRIYTTLTKKPEDYDSTAPHVEAAERAIERGEDISPGETISYVIGRGAGNISSRAEIVKYADDYDPDYYIENQVLPVTLRVLKVFGYTEGQLKGKGKQSGLGSFG